MVNKNNKETLNQLYNEQGLTLKQIGDRFGVTKERIRQVMEELGLKRNHHRSHKGNVRTYKYKNIEDYINYLRTTNHNGGTEILRRFYSSNICQDCGQTVPKIHIHHLKYPPLAVEDIIGLCPSCHRLRHSKLSAIKRDEIYNKYLSGGETQVLAKEYNVSRISIYKIIEMRKKNWRTIRH